MHRMTRPCVALLEMKWWGHHPTHLKLLAEVLLDLGCDVACACPAPDEMRSWLQERWRPSWGQFVAIPFGSYRFGRLMARILGRWSPYWWLSARRAIERLRRKVGRRPDWVFIPMVDEFVDSRLSARWVDRVFPYDWSGRVIHPYWYFHDKHWRSRIHVPRAERCRHLYFYDEVAAAEAERVWSKPCETFPEYAVTETSEPRDSEITRELRRRAAGRRIVGLFGVLDRRKGIHTMLAVARQMRSDPVYFAMIGHPGTAVAAAELKELQTSLTSDDSDNLWVHEARFDDEAEFDGLLAAADVLFAVYQDFPYNSGILSKAAAMAKPIVVASGGVMERRVRQFELGAAVDANDVTSAAAAIRELLSRPFEVRDGHREYAKLHSLEQIRVLLKRELDEIQLH